MPPQWHFYWGNRKQLAYSVNRSYLNNSGRSKISLSYFSVISLFYFLYAPIKLMLSAQMGILCSLIAHKSLWLHQLHFFLLHPKWNLVCSKQHFNLGLISKLYAYMFLCLVSIFKVSRAFFLYAFVYFRDTSSSSSLFLDLSPGFTPRVFLWQWPLATRCLMATCRCSTGAFTFAA